MKRFVEADDIQTRAMRAAMRYLRGEREHYSTPLDDDPFGDDLGPAVFALLGLLAVTLVLVFWGPEFGAWFDALWGV